MYDRSIALAIQLSSVLALGQTRSHVDMISADPTAPSLSDAIAMSLEDPPSGNDPHAASRSAQASVSSVMLRMNGVHNGSTTAQTPWIGAGSMGGLPAGPHEGELSGNGLEDRSPMSWYHSAASGGPTACDSVDIASVQWSPFNDTTLIVHVYNKSTTLFDYPGFILYDQNGDTLARETVDLFGIAQESWHQLTLHPGAVVPSGQFNTALELWSGFYQVFECTWTMTIDLCPPPPCAPLIVTIVNAGGGLALGGYSWSLFDANMTNVATGTFTMTNTEQIDADTMCLPPGSYWMAVALDQPPTGGQPYFGVGAPGWISGPQAPVVWSLPTLLAIEFLAPCNTMANNLGPRPNDQDVHLDLSDGTLTLWCGNGRALGALDLLDATGRLVLEKGSLGSPTTLSLAGWPPGVYLIRTRLPGAAPYATRFVMAGQ